jgi:hypothetical protein
MAEMVECLLSKLEALIQPKNKQKERGRPKQSLVIASL